MSQIIRPQLKMRKQACKLVGEVTAFAGSGLWRESPFDFLVPYVSLGGICRRWDMDDVKLWSLRSSPRVNSAASLLCAISKTPKSNPLGV